MFKILSRNETDSQGFALPLILIVSTFLMVGGMTMLARTFSAFRGSVRTSQHDRAQGIAETGLAKVVNQLNTTHRYLWVNCYRSDTSTDQFDANSACIDKSASSLGNWGTGANEPVFGAASCTGLDPSNYTATLTTSEDVTEEDDNNNNIKVGDWSVETYTYYGNNYGGGEGVLRVRGRSTNADTSNIFATSTIEQRIQVKAKPCGSGVFSTGGGSSFPGLLAKSISLGNNDILGLGADVYCTECTMTGTVENAIGQNTNGSFVHGDIYRGELQLPPVPEFPPDLLASVEAGAISTSNNKDLIIQAATAPATSFDIYCSTGSQCRNPPELIRGATGLLPMCVSDNNTPPESHCLITDISGNGDLTIITNNGVNPVRLYISGDVRITGNNGLINSDGGPTDVALFGADNTCGYTPNSSNPSSLTTNAEWSVRGNASLSAFIYAPCADVGISGGAQNPTCTGTTVDPNTDALTGGRVDCIDGDINGAVWAGEWDGSNSTNAEITVPANMGSQLANAFGQDFNIGATDFVGVGIKDWKSFQSF